MTLNQALKKSSVVRRASEPTAVYEKIGDDLFIQNDSESGPIKFGVSEMNRDDWQFQTISWKGSKEPKEVKK